MGLGRHPKVPPRVTCHSDRLFTNSVSWEWTSYDDEFNSNNNNARSIIRWSSDGSNENDNSEDEFAEGWPRTHMFVLEEMCTFMPQIFGDTFSSNWNVVQESPERSYTKTSLLLPLSRVRYRLRAWNAVGPSREIVVIDSCDTSSSSFSIVYASFLAATMISILYVSVRFLLLSTRKYSDNDEYDFEEKKSPHVLAFFISPTAYSMESLNLLPEVRFGVVLKFWTINAKTHVRQVRAMTAHGMFRSIEDLKCMGS